MSFRPPPALALLIAAMLLVTSRPATAWVEQTVLAHEARIDLQRTGTARVEHKIKLRVRGGPLRTFDVNVADREVTVGQDAALYSTDLGLGARMPIPVGIEQRPDGQLRVDIDGGKGVRRGLYDLELRYDVDLLKQNAIQ
ncbi:MAG: hypothetical protein MUF54_23045, partial [Polyangiaceae bacterium]|nr:hypothetical protein [Polyangiaceae bacterium]